MCVHNTPGRGRILACRACRTLLRCEMCDAAVALGDDATLRCARCGTAAPGRLPGVRAHGVRQPAPRRHPPARGAGGGRRTAGGGRDGPRRRAASPTPRCTSAPKRCCTACPTPTWWRSSTSTHELLAPRYRAAEQAMTLAGPRAPGCSGLASAAGGCWCRRSCPITRCPRRRARRPDSAARTGAGSGATCSGCRRSRRSPRSAGRAATRSPTSCGPSPGSRSVAPPDVTWCGRPRGTQLGAALIATTRPKGARVRIAVDPPRV